MVLEMRTIIKTGLDRMRLFEDQRKGSTSWMSLSLPDYSKHTVKRLDRRQRRLNTELLKAVEEGDIKKVVRGLEHGASPNATCEPLGITACHLAALAGNHDILSHLLLRGALPGSPDKEGRIPLHLATWFGNANCVKKLLAIAPDTVNVKVKKNDTEYFVVGDDLDSWNHDHDCMRVQFPQLEQGSSPIHLASQKLQLDCLLLLLDAGADIAVLDDCGMNPIDVTGEKMIGETLQNEQQFLQVFDVLVNAGAAMSPNTFQLRTTPMHTAMALNLLKAIPVISNNPSFYLGADRSGANPLHFAVTHRLEFPLRVLLQSAAVSTEDRKLSDVPGVDVKDSQGNTPLHLAVGSQWRAGVGIFLEAGADTCERNSDGASVVHLAAEIGNQDILAEILNVPESKCVLNCPDKYGETSLFKAAAGRNVMCIKHLLDAGSRLRQTRADKMTVLHRAAQSGSHEVLEELLRRDHNSKFPMINQIDMYGRTPLHLACLSGNTGCVRVLLSAGCDFNMKTCWDFSHSDCTPLHLAAAEGHHDVVSLLLTHLDEATIINSKDAHGCTPLHLACEKGHRECIHRLLLSGADLSAKIRRKKTTAMDLLFRNISQPIAFLEKILDSHIKINEYSLNDPNCIITVDYRLLAPRIKCNKQMKVLDALFDTGTTSNQESLVLHPVVESYLFLKWRSWKTWFFFSFSMYVIFLFSFAALVITEYYINTKGVEASWFFLDSYCKPIVQTTLFGLIMFELESAWRLPKYYLTDLESWLKWSSYLLAITVCFLPPKGSGDWHRLCAALGILLAWAELMFQLSRNPNWGYYINMFSTVALNVCKVLITFVFLLVGFSMAFMVLFNSEHPFENPINAFVKVTTMMTTDFEYDSLFQDNEHLVFPVVGRVLFLVFVLLVSIVLMNLLVGLAVSDIAGLQTRGKMNRLRKQSDFLRIIQPSDWDYWLIPKCARRWHTMNILQQPIEIRPGNPQCPSRTILPKHVLDALIEKAAEQKKKVAKCSMQDLFDRLLEVITLFSRDKLDTTDLQKDGYITLREENVCGSLDRLQHDLSCVKCIVQGLRNSERKEHTIDVVQ